MTSRKKGISAIAIGVTFGVLSLILVPYGFELTKSGIGVMAGKLSAPQVDFRKPFELHFDSITGVYDATQLENGIDVPPLINLGGFIPVQIRIRDEKLLVSAEVKDEAGETIAKIHDNEWVVNNNPVKARDRNYNDYAFEVIDANGIPVLQVYTQGGNLIFVNGLFYYAGGRILASPEVTIGSPTDIEVSEKLTPIFKYPSGGSPYAVPVIAVGAVLGGLALFLVPWGFEVRKTRDRKRAKKKITEEKACA
jgi:hypothetical protein